MNTQTCAFGFGILTYTDAQRAYTITRVCIDNTLYHRHICVYMVPSLRYDHHRIHSHIHRYIAMREDTETQENAYASHTIRMQTNHEEFRMHLNTIHLYRDKYTFFHCCAFLSAACASISKYSICFNLVSTVRRLCLVVADRVTHSNRFLLSKHVYCTEKTWRFCSLFMSRLAGVTLAQSNIATHNIKEPFKLSASRSKIVVTLSKQISRIITTSTLMTSLAFPTS